MKLKSILITFLLSLFLASPAFAVPVDVIWDLDAAGINTPHGDPDDRTGAFEELTFYAETTVVQYDDDGNTGLTAGDTFTDDGSLIGNGLVPGVDAEGMGANLYSNWELTGTMIDFGGYVTDVEFDYGGTSNLTKVDYRYTSGQINLYADFNEIEGGGDELEHDFGTRINTDDLNFDAADGGVLVATFDVIYGVGHTFVDLTGGDVENQGSGEFELAASYLLNGFWYFDDGVTDISDIPNINWFIDFVDYNVDDPILTFLGGSGDQDPLFMTSVVHDGSMEFGVVPEPATLMLFGIGLLGLAGISRRKL